MVFLGRVFDIWCLLSLVTGFRFSLSQGFCLEVWVDAHYDGTSM